MVAGKALQSWLKVALEGNELEIAVLNFCETHEMLAFARVLAAFHQHVECAVLMFNYSGHIARELDDVFDYVIAVDGVVSDSAVLRFSEVFYQMVWYGRPYQRAFDAAIAALATASDEPAAFALYGCRVQPTA